MKNKWFKHYNTASEGNSLDLLFAQQDYETIILFWRLLEFISKYEDDKRRGFCLISYSLLKRKLGWNRQRSTKVLSKIGQSFTIETEVQTDGEHIAVFHPKWLELQENRGGKTSSKTFQKPDRSKKEKKEVRSKKKEEEKIVTTPDELVNVLGNENLEKVLDLFPQDLVDREFPFMAIWLKQNGPKKDYMSFVVNWLKKSMKEYKETAAMHKSNQRNMGVIGS